MSRLSGADREVVETYERWRDRQTDQRQPAFFPVSDLLRVIRNLAPPPTPEDHPAPKEK